FCRRSQCSLFFFSWHLPRVHSTAIAILVGQGNRRVFARRQFSEFVFKSLADSSDPYSHSDADLFGIAFGEVNARLLKGFCILTMVEKFPFIIPSVCSMRRRVANPMPAFRASLSWLQPRSPRAPRI